MTEKLKICPCCGHETEGTQNNWEICEVCGWEDNPSQSKHPESWGGANSLSLNLSKKVWSWQRSVECPLCGNKTLHTKGMYEKCEICGWIDDPSQSGNFDNAYGDNPMSFGFALDAWHNRQSFGLLHGEGWDESIDQDRTILTLEKDRKTPLELQECPCCGTKSLLVRNVNLYCDVCEWKDDLIQNEYPDLEHGANEKSLNQAKKDWENMKD